VAEGGRSVVVPDGGGEGEDASGDAGGDSGDGAAVVVFEVELTLEGVVDRFDDLAQRFKETLAAAGFFASAGRPQQGDAAFGQGGFERAAEVSSCRR
jgi:hypothetical protein